jgi:predicted RNA-binding protein with PUA-like domain
MSYWLLKTEPSTYSWSKLAKAKRATWDGVTNAAALLQIRKVKKGDLAVLYHTGGEKAAVGVGEIVSDAHADPKNPKLAVFELVPRAPLAIPVTLAVLKETPAFADSPLVKMGRLSVVPLDATQWKTLLRLAKTKLQP